MFPLVSVEMCPLTKFHICCINSKSFKNGWPLRIRDSRKLTPMSRNRLLNQRRIGKWCKIDKPKLRHKYKARLQVAVVQEEQSAWRAGPNPV
mmetsp:Transcript_13732/g.37472  ORF Transcript_13732/g.37472 Transcript_13732/m.37472 type:complete len:92 (-) Transcript_13732:119-394(-)